MIKSILKNILRQKNLKVVNNFSIQADLRQLKNIYTINKLTKIVEDIDGDFVECGVGRGRTFLYLSFIASTDKKKRKIFGFDSFEGFPEPSKEDDGKRKPKKGEWSGTSTSDIISILREARIESNFVHNDVNLVKGFFSDTLPGRNFGPIAFLHVDVDLYDSYNDVLDNLYKFVAVGGVVLFDEYDDENWPGAKKAVDAFISKNNLELLKEERTGKYFTIKK